ncbi:hypothetical protein IJH02_03215 [Candidatus Saccharibacteria bacterium]|nr:hypothetical protein [Candidatus Saccharibacteria bacterium]
MAQSINITQPHRIVLRKKASADAEWQTLTLNPDDLGQDTQMSVNIAPMTRTRASSAGTTETPIPGTLDAFSGTISIMLDNWHIVGELIGNWKAATYEGADINAGQITDGGNNLCGASEYWSVICQGICEDGSETDIELTRCQPTITDDIEIGSSETATQTIALNPIIYNPSNHSADGYPQSSYRFGGYSTTQNMRLNPTTGEYVASGESE